MRERTLAVETVHRIFGRNSPPSSACALPGARESRWPSRGSAWSPQSEHPRDHPRADLPSQQDGAFRNCDGGVGGVESAPKAPVSFPRKEVVSDPKLWVLGSGGGRWPSKTPSPTGLELLGPGSVPGTHPVVSASWSPFLFLGPNSGTLSPFLTSANTPALLGCPCVPSASPRPLAGLSPSLVSPRDPQSGKGLGQPHT